MKHVLLVLLLIMIINPVSGAEVKHQIDQDVLISHPIRIDGGITSGVLANLTVRNPTGNIIINFQAMTYNSTTAEHQYLITAGNNSALGYYPYCITSMYNTLNATNCYEYKITTTGDELSTSQGLIYISLLFVCVLLFFLTLYASFKIKFSNDRNDEGEIIGLNDLKYLKIFSVVMCYFFLTAIMWLAWNISYAYLSFSLMSTFFKGFFYILISFMFPAIVIAFVVGVIRFFDDRKIGELIDRGISNIR